MSFRMWTLDLGEPKVPWWHSDPPMWRCNFEGGKGWPTVKLRDSQQWAVQKWPKQLRYHLGHRVRDMTMAYIYHAIMVSCGKNYGWIWSFHDPRPTIAAAREHTRGNREIRGKRPIYTPIAVQYLFKLITTPEMWANAQRDGHPVEYRWCPLFNAAVWLTPTTRVPCSNATKTRNPLNLLRVSQTNERISAASHHIVGTCGRDIAA